MWLVVSRSPAPDASVWPGRRLLALADAVAWPLLWIALAVSAPVAAGNIATFIVAVALVAAVFRVSRALFRNERYRFTTYRWGRLLALTFVIAVAAQLALMLTAR